MSMARKFISANNLINYSHWWLSAIWWLSIVFITFWYYCLATVYVHGPWNGRCDLVFAHLRVITCDTSEIITDVIAVPQAHPLLVHIFGQLLLKYFWNQFVGWNNSSYFHPECFQMFRLIQDTVCSTNLHCRWTLGKKAPSSTSAAYVIAPTQLRAACDRCSPLEFWEKLTNCRGSGVRCKCASFNVRCVT